VTGFEVLELVDLVARLPAEQLGQAGQPERRPSAAAAVTITIGVSVLAASRPSAAPPSVEATKDPCRSWYP